MKPRTHEDATPVCSPLYLERLRLRDPADLARATLLHTEVLAEHELAATWRRWLETAGVGDLRPAADLHLSHAHMALEAATAGQGVALGRGTLTSAAVRQGLLVRPFAPVLRCGLAYWLIRPRGAPGGVAVERFVAWLLQSIGSTEHAAGVQGSAASEIGGRSACG